jgi:undecaprenyl-diphosphatase
VSLLQIVVLAVVQGLTEFLPISSSAHLILLPQLSDWPDQGLAFDVAAHLGSLVAVCAYLRRDLVALTMAWSCSLLTRRMTADAWLAWAVLIGTLPVGVVGLLAHDFIAAELRSATVIAVTTVFFGALLWWADSAGRGQRDLGTLKLRDVLLIGAAQALALVPGTSRSGITMTAALALGLSRHAAARFSFLLSVPVIVLACALEILELNASGVVQPWTELALVAGCSALAAYLCIHMFLKFIERFGMWPFVLYRFALGAVLFWFFI